MDTCILRSKPDSCKACGLYTQPFVNWQKPSTLQYPVLIVGQAPGSVEAITNVPMTGPAGKMMWKLMRLANLNKRNFYICNVCQCVSPQDRKPTEQEVQCCTPFLQHYIKEARPGLIVACGDVAIKALTGVNGKVTNLRGQYFDLLDKWQYKCKVLAVLHPSFVMRQRQWESIAVADLQRVHSFFAKGEKIEVTGQPVEIVEVKGETKLSEELERLSKGIVAFDIETQAELNPRKAEVIGIAFSNSYNKAIGIDLIQSRHLFPVIKKFLEDKNVRKSVQNGQFDIACLETAGIAVKGLTFDTLLAEHILASDTPRDLDFLRGKYTDIPPYKPTKKEMKNIRSWPSYRRVEYNCKDALVTWRVTREQMKRMNDNDWHVLLDIDLPLIPVVIKMERKGMLVDTNKMATIYEDIAPKIEQMEKEVFAPLGLNPRSPVQLCKYFGLKSSGEDALIAQIKRGHEKSELMKQVLAYRDLHKSAAVYIEGIYSRLEGGRIHTSFNIAGTATSRLSSSNPNLQNVPKWLRVIYVADPGNVIIESDYSQLELRVLAVIANEQTMLEELAHGKNPHHIMGQLIFEKQWSELTDQQKTKVKAVVFGTAYGRSARSIAIEFAIPTALAEQWQASCIHKYPQFGVYRDEQTKLFQNVGKCVTPFGRTRILQTLTQALNTTIQSAAGDITKKSLIELDKAGFDLRLTVHDSIVIQAPQEQVKEVARQFKKIMERPIKELNDYMFPCKTEAGLNWYELKEVS